VSCHRSVEIRCVRVAETQACLVADRRTDDQHIARNPPEPALSVRRVIITVPRSEARSLLSPVG